MPNKTLYKGCNLINGKDDKPISDAWFLVEDKIITHMGQGNNLPIVEAKVIDLNNKVVMPGLINSHVHITMEPVGDPFDLILTESLPKGILRGAANLEKHLSSGTTYFRDLGARGGIDIELRDSVNEGIINGPEFLVSGEVITMTGGHGWAIGREADGPNEARKAAREQLKAGADIIKIMATGGIMTHGVEPGSPQLSKEEMEAAIAEAHKAGKKTSSHAQGTEGIKNAILAGIDSIEHGVFLDDETIQLMIKKDVYLVPTLVAPYSMVKYGTQAGIPEDIVNKSKIIMPIHMESFKKAYKAGVKIAMGTDAGTPFNFHDSAVEELKLMTDCGMTPMDALIASTKTSAELLGIDGEYGTLEENKYADFLVLDENPLDKIETLSNIDSVYKLGRLVKSKNSNL